MKHKVLKVKEYLKEKSISDLDARLTQAFAKFLQDRQTAVAVKFQRHESGCSCIKLKVKFGLTEDFPTLDLLSSIYIELLSIVNQNNLNEIVVNSLFVTPEIIDVYDNDKRYRGVIASVHYIK